MFFEFIIFMLVVTLIGYPLKKRDDSFKKQMLLGLSKKIGGQVSDGTFLLSPKLKQIIDEIGIEVSSMIAGKGATRQSVWYVASTAIDGDNNLKYSLDPVIFQVRPKSSLDRVGWGSLPIKSGDPYFDSFFNVYKGPAPKQSLDLLIQYILSSEIKEQLKEFNKQYPEFLLNIQETTVSLSLPDKEVDEKALEVMVSFVVIFTKHLKTNPMPMWPPQR